MQFPEYCRWQTPSVSDVYNLVLKPSEQRLEFKARKEAQMEVDRCENRKKRVWHPIEQVLSSRRLLQNVPVFSNSQFNTPHHNFHTNDKMPDASQTTYTTGWTNYPLVQS
uniref:Uncharacterized protein n=1 Tax=Caenorhabditis japonica TaxID=281687 RepID=A0A8R1EEX3_CAEJA